LTAEFCVCMAAFHRVHFEEVAQINATQDIKTLDQIRTIQRNQEIPHEGAFCDLMWSDPEEIETWQVSPRGAGWIFGSKATLEVCSPHSHFFNNFSSTISTTWSWCVVRISWCRKGTNTCSLNRAWWLCGLVCCLLLPKVTNSLAPNYCYRCGNVASILSLDENLNRDFKIFKEVPGICDAIRKPMFCQNQVVLCRQELPLHISCKKSALDLCCKISPSSDACYNKCFILSIANFRSIWQFYLW
jgi:hypothetical protein